MTKKITAIYATLALMFLTSLAVTAQAQFGVPNYGGSPYGIARFTWEGIVDGTTYVRIQRNRASSQNADGMPVQRERYNFSDPLPRASMNLDLVVLAGRGRVRLVETPRQSNDFTAIVRIDDNSGGRDLYRFELRWNDRTRNDRDDRWDDRRDDRNGRGDYDRGSSGNGGVMWSGQVDGEVIVRFRGSNAWVENVSGQGAWNDRFRFTAPLASDVRGVSLDNARGRGEVVLLEQPSQRNNYTAVVLIRDRQSGASNYSFTLTWARNRYGVNDNDDRDRRDRDNDWDRRGRN